jgi:hypothetical protein
MKKFTLTVELPHSKRGARHELSFAQSTLSEKRVTSCRPFGMNKLARGGRSGASRDFVGPLPEAEVHALANARTIGHAPAV